MSLSDTAEGRRLADSEARQADWKNWGPYVSDRAWGTVREDYSPGGTAWEYFPHDHARSRAYRWNEDGLAGFSNRFQNLALAVGLWNERDPILKERLFGVTGNEGNHGEDVKEYYFYLDGTPTHSYQKMLYKYLQVAYPYGRLVDEDRRRGKGEPEFELIDALRETFEQGRYFDVFIEYAKAGDGELRSHDILCRRLARIFLRDADAGGRRPVFGREALFQADPHWRDYVPFYEYFHGDTGAGVGASHQTGWTALVAKLMHDVATT